jgi:hypothetical protein
MTGYTEQQAAALVEKAGLEPDSRYPGAAASPWVLRCRVCGSRWQSTLTRINNGARCPHTGTAHYRKDSLYAGPGNTAMTEKEAMARAVRSGMTPVEPYPGSSSIPWKLRCDTCGAIRSCNASRLLSYTCRHTYGKGRKSS